MVEEIYTENMIKRKFYNKVTGWAVLFLLSAYNNAQDIQYGLKFKSYEVEKEKRTGLNLTGNIREFIWNRQIAIPIMVP